MYEVHLQYILQYVAFSERLICSHNQQINKLVRTYHFSGVVDMVFW